MGDILLVNESDLEPWGRGDEAPFDQGLLKNINYTETKGKTLEQEFQYQWFAGEIFPLPSTLLSPLINSWELFIWGANGKLAKIQQEMSFSPRE